jgi:hypothetical protein
MKQETQERMELKHEAEPGFRAALYIVFAMAALYLAFIFGTAR